MFFCSSLQLALLPGRFSSTIVKMGIAMYALGRKAVELGFQGPEL